MNVRELHQGQHGPPSRLPRESEHGAPLTLPVIGRRGDVPVLSIYLDAVQGVQVEARQTQTRAQAFCVPESERQLLDLIDQPCPRVLGGPGAGSDLTPVQWFCRGGLAFLPGVVERSGVALPAAVVLVREVQADLEGQCFFVHNVILAVEYGQRLG